MRMLILTLSLIAIAASAGAATYYVSASGKDSNDGLSPRSAWQTLDRVNSAALKPGDSVLFRRGDVFRGQLRPVSGDATGPVTYGAYGRGAKPRLYGSVQRNSESDWRDNGGNIWQTEGIEVDVGNIIFDDEKAVGIKVWKREDVNAPRKFYHDPDHSTLFLYCEENPAKRYASIECALKRFIIDESHCSYVTYTDLDLRYGGSHGIGGWNTSHITVRNCDLSYIGGAFWNKNAAGDPVRYGNGIEFWLGAHDNLVENCRLWQIYDSALTNQGSEKNTQANITYRNNIIWDCEFSFEYWNRPEDSVTENIVFENNTCVNAGQGWSHTQRPDPRGSHLLFYQNPAKTKSVIIRNNIFYQTFADTQCCLLLVNDWSAALTLDYNCYYQPSGPMILWPGAWYKTDQFAAYQSKTGKDAHSIVADPRFVDLAHHDFRPAADSPVCRLAVGGGFAGALPCADK